MRLRNIESHFPELLGVPLHEREPIVEQARYDIFFTNKASGRWMLTSAGTTVAALSVGFIAALAADLVTGSSPIWVSVAAGAVTAPLFLWLQQSRYVALLHPTVAKLCHARTT